MNFFYSLNIWIWQYTSDVDSCKKGNFRSNSIDKWNQQQFLRL